jgi:hypothetical protein
MIAYDAAFAGLHHDIHHAIADGNLVAVNSTMNGRHTAPWAVYTADGAVDTVFPPTPAYLFKMARVKHRAKRSWTSATASTSPWSASAIAQEPPWVTHQATHLWRCRST